MRKTPNGPAGIIRSDVPPDAAFVGVEWSDGHTSMQAVEDLIRWEPHVGDLVVPTTGGWVDTVTEHRNGCYYFARVAWGRYLHQLRPKMSTDTWYPLPGEMVRIRLTGEVARVRFPWRLGEVGYRLDREKDANDDSKYLVNQLAPVAPMREV